MLALAASCNPPPSLAATTIVAACASTDYHYSQLSGMRYYRVPIDTYPVSIIRVDGVDDARDSARARSPTRTRPVPGRPGLRQVTVQGPPGGAGGLGEQREFPLDVAPCTRYYLVAVRANAAGDDFTVRIDHRRAGERLHARLTGPSTACPTRCLTFAHLRVEFPTRRGTLVALDDISFSIAPGEILGVVGESGAGKSLTGAAIIGLLDPPGRIAGGEIRFDGRRIDNLPYEADAPDAAAARSAPSSRTR